MQNAFFAFTQGCNMPFVFILVRFQIICLKNFCLRRATSFLTEILVRYCRQRPLFARKKSFSHHCVVISPMLSDKNLNLAWYEQPKYLLRPYAGGVGAEPHKLTKRLPFYLQKLPFYLQKLPFLKLCTCPFHFFPAPLFIFM